MVKRVLIVDDHIEFRAAARALLEAGGFEVSGEASDAAEAERAIADGRPDVVLLDVHLPDENGFDLARRLVDRGDSPAIVMTSSHDASDFGSRVARSGARAFIPKSQLSGAALAEALR